MSGSKDFQVADLFLDEADRKTINGITGKDWSIQYKFGQNETVGTSYEDITPWGNWTTLTSAETMNVVSDNTADSSTGTGVRTLQIRGLDNNYDEISEDVTMNGTNAVTTTKSFLVIHRMEMLTAGSIQTNVGDITVTASSAGTTQAMINGTHSTTQAFYVVPRGYHAVLIGWETNAGKSDDFESNILFRKHTASNDGAWNTLKGLFVFESNTIYSFHGEIILPEKTCIKVQAKTINVANRPFNADFTFLLIENY